MSEAKNKSTLIGINPSKYDLHKVILYIIIGLFSFLLLITIYLTIYYSYDHSVYSKLSQASYVNSKQSVNIGFKYPTIMTNDKILATKLTGTNTPLVYSAPVNIGQKAIQAFNYLDISFALNLLKISPTQVLSQVISHNGTYIDLLNKISTTRYKELYGDCTKYITNINGQKSIVCTSVNQNVTTTKVIGINHSNQYNLILTYPTNIWNAHPKVWANIEKSFTY